jgi:macrolide transport system ATP-binding/permease protein
MRFTDILRHRLRSLLFRSQVEQELDEELRYHLDREVEENGAARLTAGVEQRKEECRDARGVNLIDNLAKDFRFAIRQLRKSRGFTFTAVFVLALGICASLAIFAFVDAALIRPLPYRDPARLVAVDETNGMFARSNLSYLDYLDWKQRNRVFDSLDVYQQTGFLRSTPAGAQPASGARVSAGFFGTLGVAPVLGRDFSPGEDSPSASRVAILSYAEWQRQYGARRDVLGRAVTLDGFPHVIVGVLPREFHFAPVGRADYWTPMQPTYSCDLRRQCHSIYGVARLREGISWQAALSNLKAIAAGLEKQYPDSNWNRGAGVTPLAEAITGEIRPILMVLLSGAGLLLLIAAVNVAGLLLLRSENRRREIAVRTALGASSGRLIAQFATEAVVLAAGASGLGIALADEAIQVLEKLLSDDFRARLPFLDGLGLNGHVAVAAGVIAILAALLLAAPPCLRIGSSDLRGGLAEAGRGSAATVWRRLGARLVTVELAAAMVLLAGAGLLGKSLYRLMRVDLGIVPDRLVTMEVVAPRSVYGTSPKEIELARRLLNEVGNLPGVQSAGIAVNGVPLTGNGNTTWFHLPDRPWHGEHYDAPQRYVSAGYFTTLGARLLRGRYFNDGDDASKPAVAIVNRALARTYFPNEDPVGRQIIENSSPPRPIQIVGIVDDIREGPLDAAIPPVLYFPFDQQPDTYFALVVRSSQEEKQLLPELAAVVRKIDAGIVPRNAMTMTDRIDDSESAYLHRSLVWLVGGFALLALLVGVVGLYGVVAYSVSQRSREIGIRMALGARPQAIYRLILGEAARLVAFGAVLGTGCSIAAAGLIRGLLFGIRSWDVSTLAAVGAILGASALAASLIPARRAATVNPADSLRAE